MIALVFVAQLVAQAEGFPRRVEVDNVGAWPKAGRIVVEGVYTTLGDSPGSSYRPMLLKKPGNVTFNVPRALLRERAPAGNIEIVGVVESSGGKLVVQVESIQLLPSDEVRFRQLFDAAGERPEKLYEAAAWAERRHQLYGSSSMKAAAEVARRAAVGLERKLAAGDPARLSALKTDLQRRAVGAALHGYDFDALEHEIVHAEFARLTAKDQEIDPAELLRFAERVHAQFDGAKSTGDAVDPRHQADYKAKPLQTYEKAEPAVRRALQRYFYSRLVDAALQEMDRRGAAPFDLAEIAKQKVPEYHDVARKWFRKWVDTQKGRLADLDGDAAAETARVIGEEFKDYAEAARFRGDWLDAKELKVRRAEREAAEESGKARVQRDADAWFDLAARRLAWFPDSPEHEAKAVRILEDVLAFAPRFTKAEAKLRGLGYVERAEGGWRRGTDPGAAPRRPSGARGLALNMTPAEVLDSLGKPTHQSRVVTAAGASVVWIYRASGRETLVVFTGPPEALRVSRVRAPAE